ncbi:MAG TPA: AAA family ATPase [Anaerolineaceae bacterium]|nr:AAA family ATPase [Anaerolineaceae bacterium]HRT28727.1 AAA family ATPase [Kiritimatiellia bacterium]
MSTYHLNSFTIGAFRGLQGMTFERLGRFNLLIGGNNSGKTSVLEALQAFCNPEDPADWARIANARNTSSRLFSTHSLNDCLVWMFPHTKQTDTGSSGSIQLSSTGACPVREVKASVQPVFGMPDEEDLRYLAKRPLDSNPATGGTYEGIEIKLDSIRAQDGSSTVAESVTRRFWQDVPFIRRRANSFAFPVAAVLGFEYRFAERCADKYSKLKVDQQKDLLELARMFDSGIESISVASENRRPYLRVEHKDFGEAPLMVFGDGMKRVLFIATGLVTAKNGLLLLDEIEGGIHAFVLPEIMKWLFKAAREYHIQIFATTHSLEAVDAVLLSAKETPDEFVTYRLSREDHLAKRLNYNLLTDLRVHGGLEIR